MKLPLKTLCLAITIANTQAVFALEALEDEIMSQTSGEGIAFLPENFAMVMRGTNSATLDVASGLYTETGASLLTDRTKDTGYIRYIPVGPLTAAATTAGAGKGDIFLYGLAISRADGNPNSRLNNTDPYITAWGTSDNPWLYKVQTDNSVPTFAATGTGNVTYLAFESPLYHQTLPVTRATGSDAYNLKLALWADGFVRRSDVVENMSATGTQFDVGGAGRANRLRLQGIWDGFSINGSEIRIFQTLNGAVTGTNGMDNFYNNTLGLTGVLRFNSGDSTTLRATTTGTATRSTTTNMRYTTTYLGRPGAAPVAVDRLYRLRSIDTVDTITGFSWTPPASMDTLRFSTQECGVGNLNGCTAPAAQGLLETSAINGTPAPTFAPNEGLNLYSPNFNLVYGQLYQPLIVGVASDNKNLVLEVARIANRQDVYSKIYTRYPGDTGDAGVTYLGSTCNVHRCGSTVTLGGTTYQGKTATHSSISIGSTNYDSTNNLITGDTSVGSVGVSFGALSSVASTTVTNRYYQLEQQTRLRNTDNQWRYDDASGPAGTIDCNTASGECYEFGVATWQRVASFNQSTIAAAYNPTIAHAAQNVTGQTNPVVPAWGPLSGASYSGTTWTSTTAPGSQFPMSSNNLGSAVIDGLLVQHLKITTKGL